MDVFSALNIGVSGIQAPSDALNTISDNISNADTVGFKEGMTTFSDVLSDTSGNNFSVNGSGSPDAGYSPSGVQATDNQLVDVQGTINPSNSTTDLAISGAGLFAVSPTPATNADTLEYTRAGSFLPDANGNYANAAGLYLQAWPLSVTGALPTGITQGSINSSTGSAALQTVNIQKVIEVPVPTTDASIQANLDAMQPTYLGPSDTAVMDSNDATNDGISANSIIVPTATDSIAQGDTMNIATGLNPTGTTFTYGGIAFTRSATNTAVDGNSTTALQQPLDLTPQAGGGTTVAFSFNPATPTTMNINLGANTPASLGVTQVGQVINLSNTAAAGGLNIDNITSLDGDYYVTAIGANNLTVTIPSNITPPSPVSLNGSTYTVGATSSSITVSGIPMPAGLTMGDNITITGAPSFGGLNGATDVDGTWAVTGVTGNSFTFSVAATSNGAGGSNSGNGSTVFDQMGDLANTNTATVSSSLFSGNIMDASTVNQELINTPSDFLPSSLNFSITSGSTISTFTYTINSPNASLGQFDSVAGLADAINSVAASNDSGLTARIVGDQLYVADTNGNQAITFTNGSTTGSNTSPPLAGINWANELGLSNIAAAPAGVEQFSTLQGLANLVNGTSGLTATVNNPFSATTVTISNSDPLDTITFSDGGTNHGSLLGELGLASSLGGGPFVAQTVGPLGPAYDAAVSATNMASGAVQPDFSVPVTVVDSDGTSHNLVAGFLKTGTNSWAVEVYAQPASDVTNAPPSTLVNGQVAVGTVDFNTDGTLASISPSLTQIGITWADGALPSTIAFNWGTAGALGVGLGNGLSQNDSANDLGSIQQNGLPQNTSTSVSISSSGLISVTYSNGNTRPVYQIPLAEFANPDQLSAVSGDAYTQTADAGTLTFLAPGPNTGVSIDPQALEASNVDLATQLTNMIIAQNAYQSNTKLISTSDQMLQTAMQMDQSITV